jgi:hypothetical protein
VPPHGETRDNVGRVPSHGETCAKEKYASDLDPRATKLPAKIPWQGRDNFHVVPLFPFALTLIPSAYEETSLLAPSRVALPSSLAVTKRVWPRAGIPLITNRTFGTRTGSIRIAVGPRLGGPTEKVDQRARPQRIECESIPIPNAKTDLQTRQEETKGRNLISKAPSARQIQFNCKINEIDHNMGNFYVNYTLRGPDQQAVAVELAGRASIVTPEQNGCVVVFDEESEEQNQEVIAELASRLSERFNCPLLAVLNHDDDILKYQLFLNGDLVDEYDSTPGYFGDDDDEAEEENDESPSIREPEGGNAKLLCETFGANSVSKVEGILRKPSLGEEGYVFAFERHTDLAAALGISEFGVGTSFSALMAGEFPEDLDDQALIKTKGLAVASPTSEPQGTRTSRPTPGYYKVSFRAVPGLTKSIPTGWMPGLWADLQCGEHELSKDFWDATKVYREQFRTLGFVEQGFKKLKRVLNPISRESGGISYLDSTRCHFGQLIYNKSFIASEGKEMIVVVVSFTALFANEVFSCTNNPNPAFNNIPTHKVLRLKSNDLPLIYRIFVDELKKRSGQPRRFDDLNSLKAWFDSNAMELFEDNVRRGIWVRMSDYEVALARRDLPEEGQVPTSDLPATDACSGP